MADSGIAYKIKNSIHCAAVDRMIDLGMNPRAIHAELVKEEPGFNDFSITTIYAYQQYRENLIREAKQLSMEDIGIDKERAPKNDSQVLDFIIAAGMRNLEETQGKDVGLDHIFRAMMQKAKILGAEYKGQTLWAILEKQEAVLGVFEIIKTVCPTQDMEKIYDECVRRGYMSARNIDIPGTGYDDYGDD